ncbi:MULTISPECIES: dihydroxyacetone kinase phosphoryl donor subunit DhaM [Haloarcula]|uniref:phosphoenolpyruvate--glycerone phosphotransferase n=1 Tax=Haloarcula pellucida TaxID=1427151 RepID=A0A830GP56_9EURY|nr:MULTISPECIES: dihydroxyacetone kinase phosphoryl donor subunit DhaM [Halomicroarcula]MBX0348050.1 PTS mannose transporter subunit IID [Halomicroarcula pellucida]MDS0277895.1 dihydroxyacetone kinase phosphoryl donor subunit DhaM [Halomicroarcula sp. S1AR25-4]GGN96667.1 PTS mannose transporter subunit IID [Halomicroarcula pellucida]
MVGLVIVSHSRKAAEGIAEVAAEMGGDTRIEPVGGDGQGGFGTVPDDIEDALAAADDGEGVVVLVDLGSAVMNADVAIEMSDVDAVIADAPVLEGAVNAAVAATSPKATLDSVREQAEAARDVDKL